MEEPKKSHKAKFTAEEDAKLKKLVNLNGPNNWYQISLNFVNRNPRQVKERWEYYLSPNVNNGPWTPEEDFLLVRKVNELGTKWKLIAQYFIGRTNTACKNRFLAMQRENYRQFCKLIPNIIAPQPVAPAAPVPSDPAYISSVITDDIVSEFEMDPFSPFQEFELDPAACLW